jgi:hypothetical protein
LNQIPFLTHARDLDNVTGSKDVHMPPPHTGKTKRDDAPDFATVDGAADNPTG